MRITIAYNLRTDDSEQTAELLADTDVARLSEAISSLGHTVTEVEVSGKPNVIVDSLLTSEPDLIFNVAEGTIGSSREAFYPGLYEQLGIPFTGGNASLLHLNLDKHLAKTVLAAQGVRVPKGILVTKSDQPFPSDIRYPLMIKPNSEGSSKGITKDSVVEDEPAARKHISAILKQYPAGVVVEEFIVGKELSIPFLEAYPEKMLSIVEHTFDLSQTNSQYNIYDYDMKQGGEAAKAVSVVCPADLTPEDEARALEMTRRVCEIMSCPDMGRVDIRLHEDGEPFFIELNPLPSLHPDASLMTAARVKGLDFKNTLRLIIRSAARRQGLATRPIRRSSKSDTPSTVSRPTAREVGIRVGRLQTGILNSITDVAGVRVGHLTRIEDNVQVPGTTETSTIRAGVTAILPAGQAYSKRLVAGGFVLNGVGEMLGLTQVMEWGWLESPILLTNSHSVGRVHDGVITHMTKKYPKLGTDTDVVIPVVGETDDSFLNDLRVGTCSSQDAIHAIQAANSGAVQQGSVGAGAGMMTFDFAGGVGTSSRTFCLEEGTFTMGVLVLSNFGKMRNLTVDGKVVGRELDKLYAEDGRRVRSEGSIIVVVATDVPLLSSQLSRISKRAALGLGRVGSHAASTSGEIIIAFSTANRTPRPSLLTDKFIKLKCIADEHINLVYEAAIEATEEAVLNAVFCSSGMTGRLDRWAPALPQDKVIAQLTKGRIVHESRQ